MVLPEFFYQKLVRLFVAFQIMEPQVPEPGGLINTAGDKDCLLARVERHRTNITVVTLNSFKYLFAVQKQNYLQIQNFLASFNFELHHLHVTRTWTTTYDFKNIFLVGDNQKNISFSIYSRDHHLLWFPPVRTFSSSRNLAEDRNPSYLTDIKFYQRGIR